MPKECGNSQPAVFSAGRLLSARLLPSCGDDGVRTRDLVVANHALSQLSYIPIGADPPVGVLGFEPRTSALSELRSSQLSYTPLFMPLTVVRGSFGDSHQTKKPNLSKVWPYPTT
jgi:hypothetical protein